jgi:hypothetical protein
VDSTSYLHTRSITNDSCNWQVQLNLCNKNELVEEVEPVDSMAYFDVVSIPHELHEDLLGKMPYFNDEDGGYVDFLRVDNIVQFS